MSGTLFVVATPIGNMEDITFRALNTLKSVDYVLAESPNHSRRLFDRYSITTKLVKFNDDYDVRETLKRALFDLQAGINIALISDAGTPTISDPGFRLVRACRESEIKVVPIPGPSALVAALSASGVPTDKFVFLGFLPKGGNKKKKILKESDIGGTIVLYESPNRVLKTLNAVKEVLGERFVVVARELTKIHEEFISGCVSDVLEELNKRPSLKGEFVILIEKDV